MYVIATAGHVDHGKSTLVRALTGVEPDRWRAERERGLTIDLGFASTTLPSGEDVAFVDVPGHERFVANMLAGLGPVPAVMMIVAADEGWMPQSTEHLSAIDALGVRHGLLVITRSDLADPEPARREALARIATTSLGDVPSVTVSGATGAGLDDLRGRLDTLLRRLPEPDRSAEVRLWVDRSFTIGGAGTVVTGTLSAGTLRRGDTLVQAGTGRRVRLRGLESLGTRVDACSAVARVALNLRGVERGSIQRGDALLTPEAWHTTDTVDVALRGDPAEDLPRELVLHVGSAAVPVRVRPLLVETARLRLAQPLPLRTGDIALLRDPGAHRVASGVTVLDPDPPRLDRRGAARRRAADLEPLVDGDPEKAAELRLSWRRFVSAGEWHTMGLPAAGDQVAEGWYADPRTWAELRERLPEWVAEWQRDHRLEPGPPAEEVRRWCRIPDPRPFETLVDQCGLAIIDGRVRPPGPGPRLPDALETALVRLEEDLGEAPFAAPDSDRLAELGLGSREIAAAVRAGRLVKVANGVVLLPDAPERAAKLLANLEEPFTLSQARQALGTTRRVAVPLLELLDTRGVTARLPDDSRRLRERD